ncbi:MAG: hypothetical protein HQL31_06330, partial [Planctomycetes bacterium]|nr:hypothetical protein [Planctomycetota bacterium]
MNAGRQRFPNALNLLLAFSLFGCVFSTAALALGACLFAILFLFDLPLFLHHLHHGHQ